MKISEYEKTRKRMADGAKRRRKQAYAMRKAGMTLQEIGDAFGVTRQAASAMIQKYEREEKK